MAAASKMTTNPLLLAYLTSLAANPLRTKMYTAAFFSALAEILAGKFAGVAPATKTLPPSQVSDKQAAAQQPLRLARAYLESAGINDRALKMALYGGLISAPLGHVMTGLLQRAFAGKTSAKDKILQIITSNLTASVVANTVYLICLSVINGARGIDQIQRTVKASWLTVMKLSWITSPVLIATAQKYLPAELWEPFFTFARFILSTYFNTLSPTPLPPQKKTPLITHFGFCETLGLFGASWLTYFLFGLFSLFYCRMSASSSLSGSFLFSLRNIPLSFWGLIPSFLPFFPFFPFSPPFSSIPPFFSSFCFSPAFFPSPPFSMVDLHSGLDPQPGQEEADGAGARRTGQSQG
ncbi:hypothetical protein ACQY0O_000669 [Thecaphora frezii]